MSPPNCLAHALDKIVVEGGYLAARRSEYWGSMHVMHVSHDGQICSYIPPVPLEHPLKALCGFDGYTVAGDALWRARAMSPGWMVASAWLFALGVTGGAVRRAARKFLA